MRVILAPLIESYIVHSLHEVVDLVDILTPLEDVQETHGFQRVVAAGH